jgi:hypothetical protein
VPTKKKEAKQTLKDECSGLVIGVTALQDKSFLVNGGTLAKADALQPMQDYVDAEEEVTTADAAYRAALAKARAAEGPARAMVSTLKPYLRVRMGKSNPALKTQFGVAPIAPPVTSSTAKAAGVVKAQTTRAKKKAAAAEATVPATPAPKPTA